MRTRSPVSTISYNTEAFLKGKLEELRKNGIIEFWSYIQHQPEDDEGGKKEHFHVYMIPNKQIDTLELRNCFMELDPNNDKPRGCLLVRSSKKFGDWALYVTHDPVYLASKHQSRTYAYEFEQLKSDDPDTLNMLWKEIDTTELSNYVNMHIAQRQGKTFIEYATEFHVPIQQIAGFKLAWEALTAQYTERNGREGHE